MPRRDSKGRFTAEKPRKWWPLRDKTLLLVLAANILAAACMQIPG